MPDGALDALVIVLDEIRFGRSRSRSEIVAHTGLGRSAVAQRVSELVERGLVRDGEPGPSTGGRPPRHLAFRGDAGHLLVADLGATSIDVALTTLDGRILAHRDEPADITDGPERCLARVEELFGEMVSGTRSVPGRTWGIGIGLPAPVEFRTGRPRSPTLAVGWDDFPVRERFTERLGAPTWVDNDANLLALGEWRSGIAAGHDNVVVVKVGSGIGAGIIGDGRLYRGAQGSAGDVGHNQVLDAPSARCRCGNTGCLELMASGPAIAREGLAAARDGASARLAAALDRSGTVTAADVGRAAAQGDEAARAIVREAGRLIGVMLAAVVNFINPSMAVIGGGVSQCGETLLDPIRETVRSRALPIATRDLIIERTALGGLAGVVGAAAMVGDQLFSRESIGRWVAAGDRWALADGAISAG
jgi:glucokinase-like ROK family protein